MNQILHSLQMLVFDFDGVFTDGKVTVREDGLESVICSRRDTLGLYYLKCAGIKLAVISSESNPVVRKRCEKMGIECHGGILEKLPVFQELLAREGVTPAEAAFMGDDINDLACLNYAGYAFVPADAREECLSIADYITARKGGDHAVREICDLILSARK